MGKLEIFLIANFISIVLVIISVISFATNNVADAIFYIAVALLIRQGIDKYYD